jgi:hypothetical protein
MGMFDWVRCEVPLPDGFDGPLQTKDFACELGEHVITKDGRLMLAALDRVEEVPKEERPYPDAAPGTLQSFCGIIRSFWKHEDANFHGIMRFYGLECGRWHEYNAKFTDGQLVDIVQVSDRDA